MNSENTTVQINKGLKIGKENKVIAWGTSFADLKDDVEGFTIDETGRHHIYFGKKELFPDISLGLYTPFDTCHENFNDTALKHAGQNLNLQDVPILIEKLTNVFGYPTEAHDWYGMCRKWKINAISIEIIPRSHHGSDWSSIIIKNESL